MPAAQAAAVIIPAFNEAATIAEVVRTAAAHGLVIVVDDGSADATAQAARAAGAHVVRHARNSGYDAALETGLRTAAELGAAWAVTLDADGQHDPACLAEAFTLLRGGAELVLGCRGEAARWSEAVFNAWTKARFGVPDILCGLKGYGPSLLRLVHSDDNSAGGSDDGNTQGRGVMAGSIGTGLALQGLRAGLRPALLTVRVRPRLGQPRIGGALRANLRILGALLRACTKFAITQPARTD